MKAIRVHQFGGPEVLRYEDVPLPEPGAGEARVNVEAVGLNYIDVYRRKGQIDLAIQAYRDVMHAVRIQDLDYSRTVGDQPMMQVVIELADACDGQIQPDGLQAADWA